MSISNQKRRNGPENEPFLPYMCASLFRFLFLFIEEKKEQVGSYFNRRKPSSSSKVVNISATTSMQVVLARPERFEQAMELAKTVQRAMVIGGGSIYRQMLPLCDTAYVTKVHTTPESDTFFPNLDADPAWRMTQVLQSGQEDGIDYEMCLYQRVAEEK